MNTRLHEQIVALNRIDSTDTTYRITTRTGIEDLTASVNHFGILHAPILQPRGAQWIVVAGFRRIDACRAIGLIDVAAKLLPSEATERQRIELAIADNSLQRPLTLIEVSRSLELLSRCHADRNELAVAAAKLNLPDSRDLITKLLHLSTLPESIQNGVRDEVIALAMALTLGDLEAPVADEWVRIFRDLNLGLNRQRELLTLVAEIAIREDRGIADVLFDNRIRQILSPTDADAAQKYRVLAAHLRQRRFPHIARAERRFDDLVQTLSLGPHARLTPPAHFEGTTYRLQLLFRSPEELERHRQAIEKLLDNPKFKAVLE